MEGTVFRVGEFDELVELTVDVECCAHVQAIGEDL